MKRIFALLMAVAVLGFVVAGCGGGSSDSGKTDTGTGKTDSTENKTN